jgi:hypothetical protein
VTPAVLARLAAQFTSQPPRPAASLTYSAYYGLPVFTAAEKAREKAVLERLATLTTVHGPWKAAAILFGGTR